MNTKKSLVTVGAVATMAVAGTGIASAADTADTASETQTDSSAGSIAFDTDADSAISSLDEAGDVAKDITGIADAFSAAITASSDFGGVISDSAAFLAGI